MLRIAVTGPESTGKSTLAEKLAGHYQTVWVPEYAREYIGNLNRLYTLADIEEIARQQLATEQKMASAANKVLFCDTDLFVIKVWAEHAFGQCPAWILEEIQKNRYDFHLLLNTDLPWQPDPQREHPHLRQHFIELYKKELTNAGVKWQLVSGTQHQRLEQAILVLRQRFPDLSKEA